MNFNDLDFLIYSSHKTSTQTLLSIINNNKLKSIHCHILSNLVLNFDNIIISNETFIQGLINYKNINKKKLRIISIIRNPKDRLISSFFQSFSTDEIHFLKKNIENTTVNVKTAEELSIFYEELVNKKKLPGLRESIDEMSDIFKINIIANLEKKKDYYYLNNDLFELYVLDFNKIIGSNTLNYLNKILNTKFTIYKNDNLSKDKDYYDKYLQVKKILGNKLDNIIKEQYNAFYFTSFKNDEIIK
jgi:hypothetical protein